MNFNFTSICLLAASTLFTATSAIAGVNPAYVGLADDQRALESAIQAGLTTADTSVTCSNVIFVRLSGSVKTVLAGLCATKGKPAQMACANLSSNKSALAERAFPELTLESELRMHMSDACELN